jgi:hypothetical protein
VGSHSNITGPLETVTAEDVGFSSSKALLFNFILGSTFRDEEGGKKADRVSRYVKSVFLQLKKDSIVFKQPKTRRDTWDCVELRLGEDLIFSSINFFVTSVSCNAGSVGDNPGHRPLC